MLFSTVSSKLLLSIAIGSLLFQSNSLISSIEAHEDHAHPHAHPHNDADHFPNKTPRAYSRDVEIDQEPDQTDVYAIPLDTDEEEEDLEMQQLEDLQKKPN